MENQEIKKHVFDRRHFYNDDDSGKVFIFALVLPILLSIVFVMISNVIAGTTGIESSQISNNIWFTSVFQLVNAGLLIGLFFTYNKINKISFSAINLKFKMSWHTYLVIVAIAIIVLFGVQYFISAVDKLLEVIGFPLENSSPDSAESLTNPKSFGIFILSVFITALLPSITEELLFRGIILNGFRKRYNDICSIFMSALMFALMHQNLQQLIYPFLLGSVMAWIVLRTGSLFSSMIVHFINNFLVILFAYLKNVANFSLALPNTWWFYLIAVILLLLTVAIIFLIDRFYFKSKSKDVVQQDKTQTSKFVYISLGIAVTLFVFITIFNFL